MNLETGTRAILRVAFVTKSLSGWQRSAAAAVAGALSTFALAPYYFAPVLFLTLPVFLWLIEGSLSSVQRPAKSRRLRRVIDPMLRGGAVGWWFGFGFHLTGLYWIGHAFLVQAEQFAWLLPIAVTLLPAGLALFHWAAGAATAAMLTWLRGDTEQNPKGLFQLLAPVFALAIALSMTEWLRGHILTGFPWNVLGYALTWPIELMQAVGLIGIYGLTLLTPIVFAAPLVIFASLAEPNIGKLRYAIMCCGPTVLIVGLAWGYGTLALAGVDPVSDTNIRLRLVQPSIPQNDKWKADKQREIFEEHLRLSGTGEDGKPDGLAGITHVIWAEASMPFMPLESTEAIDRIGQLLPKGTRLLAGALRRDLDKQGRVRVYNSLIVFGEGGRFEGVYDKIHLVPFGEYLPFQEWMDAIGIRALVGQRGGFASGESPRLLMQPAGLVPLAVLICYEAVFPAQVLQGDSRPKLLVNVTNDGWFGHSSGPYQHYHQARLRAVEEGLPLIRVANNGVSAVIDSRGRVLKSLDIDQKGVLDTALPMAGRPTLFARIGDLLFWVLWSATGICIYLSPRRGSKMAQESQR